MKTKCKIIPPIQLATTLTTNHTTIMQPKVFVTTLALSLVGFSVLGALASLLATGHIEVFLSASFIINLVLAILMIQGENWARWWTSH
jgi:lysylphosphatidylglycerol synthetase-like protein (DUF2156 family)